MGVSLFLSPLPTQVDSPTPSDLVENSRLDLIIILFDRTAKKIPFVAII